MCRAAVRCCFFGLYEDRRRPSAVVALTGLTCSQVMVRSSRLSRTAAHPSPAGCRRSRHALVHPMVNPPTQVEFLSAPVGERIPALSPSTHAAGPAGDRMGRCQRGRSLVVRSDGAEAERLQQVVQQTGQAAERVTGAGVVQQMRDSAQQVACAGTGVMSRLTWFRSTTKGSPAFSGREAHGHGCPNADALERATAPPTAHGASQQVSPCAASGVG